jgi:hypothetical protein
MDALARAFDAPLASRDHRVLAESAWMGGYLVSVRYYLGRLLNKNLFRESDAQVEHRIATFIDATTSKEGASLVAQEGSWQLSEPILRFRYEAQINGESKRKPREVAAIEAFLQNPSITLGELARKVGTTEKQLCRMSLLNVARALPARSCNRRVARKAQATKSSKRSGRRSPSR